MDELSFMTSSSLASDQLREACSDPLLAMSFFASQLEEERLSNTGRVEFGESSHGFLDDMQLQPETSLGFLTDMHLQPQNGMFPALNDPILLGNSVPLCSRPMGIEGIGNSSGVVTAPNLNSRSSNQDPLGNAAIAASLKGKMSYLQQDVSLNLRAWRSFARGSELGSSNNPVGSGLGYSLYDEKYQAIGLPIDPHMRIFNATNGIGK